MHKFLRVLISSDKLLGKEDEARLTTFIDGFEEGRTIDPEHIVWVSDKTKAACKKLLDSSPDLGDNVIYDDSFMHELDNISEEFKDTSDCFGFEVSEYQDAFSQYGKDISELLIERIKAVRTKITKSLRHTASDVLDELPFRIKVAFGNHPCDRTRWPVLTPNTFAAMAETLMKFEDAMNEV
jgi:hypothetical protein